MKKGNIDHVVGLAIALGKAARLSIKFRFLDELEQNTEGSFVSFRLVFHTCINEIFTFIPSTILFFPLFLPFMAFSTLVHRASR